MCDSRLDYHATTYQRVSISATENPSASLYYGSFQRAFFILCGEFRHQPHHPGATRPLVTKGRNRTFDLRSGYGFSSNLCLCALGIGHLLLHRSSTELPLHIWGGEQVMSLHPCIALKRYRNARYSIRDTAYKRADIKLSPSTTVHPKTYSPDTHPR